MPRVWSDRLADWMVRPGVTGGVAWWENPRPPMIHDPKSRCAARTQNVESFEVKTPDEVRALLAEAQRAEAADDFVKFRFCAQCLVTPVRTESDMVKLPGAAQPNATPVKEVPASDEAIEQQLVDSLAARPTGTRTGAKTRSHTGSPTAAKSTRKAPARAPRARTRKAVTETE